MLLLIAIVVILVDQLSKLWVRSFLQLGESFPQDWPVRLTYVQNTGIAFGLKANQLFLVFITLAIVIALLVFSLRYNKLLPRLVRIGIGLMLGGAIGNFADRISQGYVTDFFDLQVWPVFNIADSSVVVGVGLLMYFFLFRSEGKQQNKVHSEITE